jgi:hypothetical protein
MVQAGCRLPYASGHKPRTSRGENASVIVAGESFERVCALELTLHLHERGPFVWKDADLDGGDERIVDRYVLAEVLLDEAATARNCQLARLVR